MCSTNKLFTVYKLIFSTGMIYVGQSSNLAKRLQDHQGVRSERDFQVLILWDGLSAEEATRLEILEIGDVPFELSLNKKSLAVVECLDCGVIFKKKKGFRCEPCRSVRYRHPPEKVAADSARRKERMKTDPEYAEAERKRRRDWFAEKRKNDPEWRAKKNARQNERRRERLATEPGYKEKVNAYKAEWTKKRKMEDPEFRKSLSESGKRYRARKAATDPEWVAKERERKRILAQKIRDSQKQESVIE